MIPDHVALTCSSTRLTYRDVCALADRLTTTGGQRMVVLDLSAVTETSTAALARLVCLRRDLLGRGRDLRIVGLRGRANDLYEISRLRRALPRLEPPPALVEGAA